MSSLDEAVLALRQNKPRIVVVPAGAGALAEVR
jgi:hypothetical protein